MNRLAHEHSAYLRHAADQKVDWYPWSDEAFRIAREEDKPIFLSSGAVWCHWCHVMARESFANEEIARILNEQFVSIKLDRDERPDIDRRYQQAVAVMGGGSGWPLTVFLTPDGEPFFGGTYFPPEDRQGMQGLKSLLPGVHRTYREQRENLREYAQRLREALQPDRLVPRGPEGALLEEAEQIFLRAVDEKNGGFGNAPKFPMPGALAFLIRRARLSPNPAVRAAAIHALTAMAQGGVHDHLAGGFHRYATDEAWTIPHFEKMADDNAGLLKVFTDGFASFGDDLFREAAQGIVAFLQGTLTDPAGGFYASQDADVTPEDEGGYFLWTGEEFRKALSPDAYDVLAPYLLHDEGGMPHDRSKKVLFVNGSIPGLAQRLGQDPARVRDRIREGKGALLAVRQQRKTPFIDRALYTDLNGMAVSSFFHAYCLFGDESIREFGVMSLERILRERRGDAGVLHTAGIPALLDDYVNLVDALVGAGEATADHRYFRIAVEMMDACLTGFYDEQEGGFFDTREAVLGMRLKHIEDVPHRSANSLALSLLLKLSYLTGSERYRLVAERSLGAFAGRAREIGVHAGGYLCALDDWSRMVLLTVEALPDSELARAARRATAFGPIAIRYGEDRGQVVPCMHGTCSEPITDPALLLCTLDALWGIPA